MNRNCQSCIFYDVCSEKTFCDGYYPVDERDADELLFEKTEALREEYRAAFFEYMEDFD